MTHIHVLFPYKRKLLNRKKGWTVNTYKMDESSRLNEKPDKEEYIMFDFINVKF